MGSSVSVSVKSQRLKGRLYDFLRELYRPWPEIEQTGLPPLFRGPSTELAFANGSCLVGFDYTRTSQAEREYNFALIRWAALQVGRRRRRFRGEGVTLDKPVPYYVVGGYEPWPILLDTEWSESPPDMRWWLTDKFGMNTDPYVVRELAWYHIPDGAHQQVTATHHGQSAEAIREALVQTGLAGAQETLHTIQSQIARLDVLWRDVAAT